VANHLPLSPGPTYNTFMNRAMDLPLLSKDEELSLVDQWRSHKNKQAFDTLFLSNVRLVVHIAKIYRHYGLNIEDLIQEGFKGLAQAIGKFDSTAEVRFGVYASMWIKASVRNYIIDNQHIVRIATTNPHKKLFFSLRRYSREGRWMTPEERDVVCKELKVTDEQIRDMELRLSTTQASILSGDSDEHYDEKGFEGLSIRNPSPSPEDLAEQDQETRHLSRDIAEALSKLSDQEQDILRRRVMIANGTKGPTLSEIGDDYGVTSERIRQIEAKAILALKTLLHHRQGEVE